MIAATVTVMQAILDTWMSKFWFNREQSHHDGNFGSWEITISFLFFKYIILTRSILLEMEELTGSRF